MTNKISMKNILIIITGFFLLFFLSCDYRSDIDLIVENNTSGKIQIIYSFDGFQDTSSISSETKLVVANIYDTGLSTEGRLKSLESIPLDVLEIRNKNGLLYNKDILDIDNWEKIDPENKGGEGKVLLKLTDSDF